MNAATAASVAMKGFTDDLPAIMCGLPVLVADGLGELDIRMLG